MARRRLLAIFGALGLGFGLISSGIAAQAETEPPTLNALIWTWSWSTQNVCNSNSGTATLTGGVCTIDQTGPTSEDNVAICVQNNVPGGGSCVISQTNGTEDNRAIVLQRNNQSGSASENAIQQAQITQNNTSGRNDVWVGQLVNQSTSSSGKQTQGSQQFDTIDQVAVTGGQKVLLGQLSNQRANSSTFEQDQFSNQDVSESGGLGHHIDQTSTGLSEIAVGQAQIQTATGSGVQSQVVDPRCCSSQTGNPNDQFKIFQFVVQKNNATPDEDPQDATSVAACHTDGTCTAFQSTTNNTDSTTNSCPPNSKDCVAVLHCSTAGGCTKTPNCTGEGCPPTPAVCPSFACGITGLLNTGAWGMASAPSAKTAAAARSAPAAVLST
jgi:hypothetical protein